jgi:hypothetical protein
MLAFATNEWLTFSLPADYFSCSERYEMAFRRFGDASEGFGLRYLFEEYTFDTDLQELHRGLDQVSVAPQAFDLLDYLIRNRSASSVKMRSSTLSGRGGSCPMRPLQRA